MATYYFRNSGSDWGTAANWSLSSGGPADGAVPTNADDVIFNVNSGNCTVNASNRVCKSITFNGYTNTITMSFNITVGNGSGTNNNITFQSDQSSRVSGSGILIASSSGTITSNGGAWPNPFNFTGTSQTFTLADNLTLLGLLTIASTTACTINGNVLNCTSLTCSTAAITSGTTKFNFNNNGTWQHTNPSSQLRNNVDINSNVTIGTNVNYNTGTLKYVSGTPVVTGSALNIGVAGATLDTNGMSWNNVAIIGVTVTVLSDLSLNGNLNGAGIINTITASSSTNVNVNGSLIITGGFNSRIVCTNVTINLVGTGSIYCPTTSYFQAPIVINTTNPSGYVIGSASVNSLVFAGTASFEMVGNLSTASVYDSSTQVNIGSSSAGLAGNVTFNTNLGGSGGNQIIYSNTTLTNNSILILNSTTEFSGIITCSGNATFSGTDGFITSGFTNTTAGAIVILQNINANPNAEYIVSGQLTLIGTAASRVRLEAAGSSSFTGTANGTALTYSSGAIPTVGMTVSQSIGTAPAGFSALFPNRPVINGGTSPNFTLDQTVTPSTGSIAMRAGFKAIFTLLNNGATQNVAYTTTQDIDSSDGQTILSFGSNNDDASANVSLYRTLNWRSLVAPSQSQYAVFGD